MDYAGDLAINKAVAPRQPAAIEANDRIEKCAERVRDLSDRVHTLATQVVGEAPPTAEGATIAAVDRGGLMGSISSLERAISSAEDAFRRLS